MPAGGSETVASRREPSEALPAPGAKAAFASRKEINGLISEQENSSECGCRAGRFPARIPGRPAAVLVVPRRSSPVGSAGRMRWGAQPGLGFDAPREQFGTVSADAFHVGAWAPCASGFGFGKSSLSGTGLHLSGEICALSPSVLLSALLLIGAYSKPSGSLDASPNKAGWRGDAVVFLLAEKSRSCTAFLLSSFRDPCRSKEPPPSLAHSVSLPVSGGITLSRQHL